MQVEYFKGTQIYICIFNRESSKEKKKVAHAVCCMLPVGTVMVQIMNTQNFVHVFL